MQNSYSDGEFASFLGSDPFAKAFSIHGEVFREIKNRKTVRFAFGGGHCFIKIHRGVGWREIIKNLTSFKRPVLGAVNEYLAIRHCEKIGLNTMKCRAFSERYSNPAKRESFIITDELQDMTSLEDLAASWLDTPPTHAFKVKLISLLAETCAKMHFSGLNHRDCYLCHFLLDNKAIKSGETRLYVLDLHRAEIRGKVPRRLQVKDVAGIYFSSMDLTLTKSDMLRFVAKYSSYGELDSRFWRSVGATAERLYRKEWGRAQTRGGIL